MLPLADVRESKHGRTQVPEYAAFLRGINVGGHRVKMDRLRTMLEELGLADVSTFLASGNVMFSSDSDDPKGLRDGIEAHLERGLGYEVPVFLRSPAELEQIVAFRPPESTGQVPSSVGSHYVILLDPNVRQEVRSKLSLLASDSDRFHFADSEVHWLMNGKLSESQLFDRELDRAMRGIRHTMRNMNTLSRMAVRMASSSPGG